MTATRPIFALTALTLAALACKPVIAVGWRELLIILLLALVLIGPPLFRFWARWEAFKRHEAEKREKGK